MKEKIDISPYFDLANLIFMNLQFLPCFLHHENHKTLVNPIVQCWTWTPDLIYPGVRIKQKPI